MAFNPVVVDADAKTGALTSGGFQDQDFTATNGQTIFTLAVSPAVDSATKIDVFIDGRMQQETASWNRTTGAGQKITLTAGATTGSWVRVRLWFL